MNHTDNPLRPVEGGVSPTLVSRMGTGGNQIPILVDTDVVDDDLLYSGEFDRPKD